MAEPHVSEAGRTIFFGFVAVFAAWMFEWDGMQKYYLAHYVVANTGVIHKFPRAAHGLPEGQVAPGGPG